MVGEMMMLGGRVKKEKRGLSLSLRRLDRGACSTDKEKMHGETKMSK